MNEVSHKFKDSQCGIILVLPYLRHQSNLGILDPNTQNHGQGYTESNP